jgi:hypothetical protein
MKMVRRLFTTWRTVTSCKEMPSASLQRWLGFRARELDEIEQSHQMVGGTGRGRRYATQQINRAYATLLSSQFQGFCRDLHSECVDYILETVNPPHLRTLLRVQFTWGRQIDRGNPNPAGIGSDFNRFGLDFWREVKARHALNERRSKLLEELNEWRNAIAHQDFTSPKLPGSKNLLLGKVKAWRRAINRLASDFDEVMRARLESLLGTSPW